MELLLHCQFGQFSQFSQFWVTDAPTALSAVHAVDFPWITNDVGWVLMFAAAEETTLCSTVWCTFGKMKNAKFAQNKDEDFPVKSCHHASHKKIVLVLNQDKNKSMINRDKKSYTNRIVFWRLPIIAGPLFPTLRQDYISVFHHRPNEGWWHTGRGSDRRPLESSANLGPADLTQGDNATTSKEKDLGYLRAIFLQLRSQKKSKHVER